MNVQESLGADLAAAREARDLTLEQVEQQIKIRVHYLTALENEDYAALPSIVQGRGFLRNYARFLKLDVDEVETRFNLGLIEQSRSRRRRSPPQATSGRSSPRQTPQSNMDTPQPMRRSTPAASTYNPSVSASPIQVPSAPTRRNGLVDPSAERAEQRRRQTRAMTMRAVGALIVAAFILVVLLTYGTHPNLIPGPIAAVLGIQPTATTTPTPLPPTIPIPTAVATVQPTVAPVANVTGSTPTGGPIATGGVSIEITVHDRAPLQIKVDDQIVYSGVPVPNTVLKYQAKQTIQVHTGDAGSLDIAVNGIKQPAIGLPHTIADKTFTVTNSQAPVATAAVQPSSAFITFTPNVPPQTPVPTIVLPTVGLKP